MANQVVDVSTFQQTIDWSQVKQDGIVGAMIRAGYGFGTVDNQYRVNVTGCENNGIPYGMYHYSYATNIEDAKKEAEFLSITPKALPLPTLWQWMWKKQVKQLWVNRH